MRNLVLVGLALMSFVSLGRAAAAPAETKIVVNADGVARKNAPVVAVLKGVKLAPPTGPAMLQGRDHAIMAQIGNHGDGEIIVRWVQPELGADEKRTYTLTGSPALDEKHRFRFVDGGADWRDLYFGDRPVMSQIIKYDEKDHAGTFKPFDQVYSFRPTSQPATQPHGERDRDYQFITKGVGGQYTHHRGIFFGFNKTAYGDFWHCPDVSQRHESFDTSHEWAGPIAAKMVAKTGWVAKDGQEKFRDTRDVTAWRVGENELVLDYAITLETLTGKPETVGGDAHHAGFHFRASNELADTKDKTRRGGQAAYVFPPTAKLVKDDVYSGVTWANASFDLFGRRYSVTHMDGAENPKPTTYSTRRYGRFGAFFTSETTPEKPLKLNYRLVIRDTTGAATTQPTQGYVEAEYESFIKPVKVTLAP